MGDPIKLNTTTVFYDEYPRGMFVVCYRENIAVEMTELLGAMKELMHLPIEISPISPPDPDQKGSMNYAWCFNINFVPGDNRLDEVRKMLLSLGGPPADH